ncbi:hypothetical protein GCK72_010417 [Caenorhabditis remanei]|uniref:Ribosomal protein L7/L12 C-terminal domain-containing protein n=2 Tax=Caenorhabditis remanei TaxID=31234 RepID=A0A6A5H537_CAERE|nr:hypothetical protein GCK72_010417 [Caenorhabditis remanei]KAF1762155.1 hypothetical protein GCK72_010417 [Caenorhabditis remanei]
MLARTLRPISKVFRSSAKYSQAAGLPLNEGSAAPLPSEDRAISSKVSSLVEEIANLSLLDVSDLNWALKKRLNIPDQPLMAASAFAPAAAAAPAAQAEAEATSDVPQKMTFTVKLTKFDDTKKIAIIKEIRNAIPGLNLVQAKKFVETAPVNVKEDLGKAEAEELKGILEKAGAVIEIV